MRRSSLGFSLFLLWIGAVFPLQAAHTAATLLLAADHARPGTTVMAGVRLTMEPGWHTYWRNPGTTGMQTEMDWHLPKGVTAGPIRWPVPEKQAEGQEIVYDYSGTITLLVPLTIAADAPTGTVELSAKLSWLECNTSCVPGKQDVRAQLTIGATEATAAGTGPEWAAAEARQPAAGTNVTARATWEKAKAEDSRTFLLEGTFAGDPKTVDFFPFEAKGHTVEPKTEVLAAEAGRFRLRVTVTKFSGEWPASVAGLLVQKAGAEAGAVEVRLPITDGTAASAPPGAPGRSPTPAGAGGPAAAGPNSLAAMLLYAFLGGLILNLMPCVLPVIALKILGFVNHAHAQPGAVRRLGLIYGAGVVVSFLALAGMVIGVKAAGHQAGWGMQFGSPMFIVLLTALVTLVALNLFGVFEVHLSGRLMGAAGDLGARDGAAGAFFNGVLATVLATPCTAPFLGIALGFAFGQSAAIILLIFLAAGVGLAAPYVVLSWNPAWLKLLPKPGLWMVRFKVLLGFPMLMTAFWLLELTPVHYGTRVVWLGIFLVLLALAAWMYGEFVQRGESHQGMARLMALMVLVGGGGLALEKGLHWREPLTDNAGARAGKSAPGGIAWTPWSAEAVAQARAAGHPVLVDFTADWCFTCQVNLHSSIDVPSVREKLRTLGVVALVGDYTKFPDNITTELQRFGRAGVPLVLVYPADAAQPATVLPDGLLTPGVVLQALTQAGGNPPAQAKAAP